MQEPLENHLFHVDFSLLGVGGFRIPDIVT